MMRSLYSGVSGLRNHQTKMDVIGDNIANVNTTGFKSSRVVFQDVYSQTIRTASAASDTTGGTNPSQIGLGVKVGAIDVLFSTGSSANTNNSNDLMISGDGFFVIQVGGETRYTRAGNFYNDAAGMLVTSDGYYVMGYTATANADGTVTVDPDADLIKIDTSDYYNCAFDTDGVLWGYQDVVNNGVTETTKHAIAQVALAMFANDSGLEKTSSSLYAVSANSGDPTYTVAGAGGAGTILPGYLEMSNVDLAYEFTEMIITQRGFQANSRVITTSDSMLEELVNLKR